MDNGTKLPMTYCCRNSVSKFGIQFINHFRISKFNSEFLLQDRDSMKGQTDDECLNPSFATFLHYPQSPNTIFKTLSRSKSSPANFFCGSPLCVDNVVTTTVAPSALPIVSSTTAPTMKCLYQFVIYKINRT